MIGLAVLLMLVAAAIKFTGTSSQASVSKAKADQLAACANTSKRTLLSRLRTFGVPVTNVQVNESLPDGLNSTTQSTMLTGHYDATGPEPTVIKLESSAMGQSRKQLRDMSNTLSQTTLGGSYYRVVARCRSPVNGAESEVEFTFRHGI
jgi:hypothetical protein